MDASKLIPALKGISSDSPLVSRLAELAEKKLSSFKFVTNPGDTITKDVVMAVPSGSDLWYLFNHVNMLTWVTEISLPSEVKAEDAANSFVDRRLTFLNKKLYKIKPLYGIVSKDEVKGLKTWVTDKMHWSTDAKDWVQLLASEIRFAGQSFQYSTEVPMPKDAVGYIMIPIGGQGVMEVISLIQETLTEVSGFDLQFDEKPKTINADEGIRCIDEALNLLPPARKDVQGWQPNACYGRKLIEKTSLIPEKERSKVFIESRFKTTFADILSKSNIVYGENIFRKGTVINTKIDIPMEKIYGKGVNKDGSANPSQPGLSLITTIPTKRTDKGFIVGGGIVGKHWLRVWITRNDKFPVPGEFIGILTKPVPTPPHVWWFQRSSPLLYAGNWMDTLDLTSGVITKRKVNGATRNQVIEITLNEDGSTSTSVLSEAWITHPESRVNCAEYTVRVKGILVRIYSSDHVLYDVGKRVAIWKDRSTEVANQLKEGSPGENYLTRPDIAYDQLEQQHYGDPQYSETPNIYTLYVILPLTFFG